VSACSSNMKAIKIAEFDIIKCGVEFITGLDSRPGVEELLPHMERNENYVYWMQPRGGSTEQQQACIHVNGTYYALNNKLEKAIFRNVRLTRDFKNYECLVDGTRKLVIPQRLFQEKLRTSNRVPPSCFVFLGLSRSFSVFLVSARRFRPCLLCSLSETLSQTRGLTKHYLHRITSCSESPNPSRQYRRQKMPRTPRWTRQKRQNVHQTSQAPASCTPQQTQSLERKQSPGKRRTRSNPSGRVRQKVICIHTRFWKASKDAS
jgi:hypothetical protein